MSSRPKASTAACTSCRAASVAAHRSDDGGGPAAVGLDGPDRLGGDLRVNVVDDDGGALAGEFPGVGQAEAPAASGDDCYFP